MQDRKHFKVRLGDSVQLQYIPEDDRERLNARVIGHAAGRSIIISAPGVAGRYPILREHQPFVVRMLHGNQVHGFESEVLKYYTAPFSHVHLKEPDDIASITVRSAPRVDTALVISVKVGDAHGESATMLNTSATGALIRSHRALGNIGDPFQISLELIISGIQKYLRFDAVIRNLARPEELPDNDGFRYGVEFVGLDEEQKLILHAYVNEQIVLQLEE